MRAHDERISLAAPERGVVGFAEPNRGLGDRLVHRSEVERRLADHLQHVRDRGLLVERLFGLVEQADVLDRDRRLIGERLNQADLLVAEGIDLHPRHADDADDVVSPHDWYAEDRVHVVLAVRRPVVLGVFEEIRDVDGPLLDRRTPHERRAPDARRVRVLVCHELWQTAARRHEAEHIAVAAEDVRPVAVAEPIRVLHRDVEHGAQVECGSADRLEDVGGRRLLLESVLRLVEEANVFDRDDRLVCERLDEVDFAFGERPRCPPRDDHDADRRRVAKERNGEHAPRADRFRHVRTREFRCRLEIRQVDDSSFLERSGHHTRPWRRLHACRHRSDVVDQRLQLRRSSVPNEFHQPVAFAAAHPGDVRVA